MKLVALALVSCALAFAQSDPAKSPLLDGLKPMDQFERLQQHLKGMKLMTSPLNPPDSTAPLKLQSLQQMLAARGRLNVVPRVCAIPLLQALPAQDRTEFKLQVVRPAVPPEQPAASSGAGTGLGIPACK
jgi:hypothetical protein